MICYIAGAGDFYFSAPAPGPGDLIIAADGGYKRLEAAGISPDLIVGDFDSSGAPKNAPILRLPSEKDDTDTLAAIKEGLARGYKTFYLLGGTGGRFDHTLANLQCLAFLAKNGARGFLFGKQNVTTVIFEDTLNFPKTATGYLSIFAFGETAKGVTLENLKYPLSDATLTHDFPLGVSNEFTGNPARVSVETGLLTIITEGVLPL